MGCTLFGSHILLHVKTDIVSAFHLIEAYGLWIWIRIIKLSLYKHNSYLIIKH